MLREFFPSTDQGAEVYGGFLHSENCFCRMFEMKNSIPEALVNINNFLSSNGYATASAEDFDNEYRYEEGPVSISPHGYQSQFVMFIYRDIAAKPQINFIMNRLSVFSDERDWYQFHNPKDLAIALTIESNELLEVFLWKSNETADKDKIKEELADVFSYAFLLAKKCGLNVEEIILDKIKSNSVKYPVDKAKGSAKKYNDL